MGYLLFLAVAGCITLFLMIVGLERGPDTPVLFFAAYWWGTRLVPAMILFWIIRKRALSVKDHLLLLFGSIGAVLVSAFLFAFRSFSLASAFSRILLIAGVLVGVAALVALVVFLTTSRARVVADGGSRTRNHSVRHRFRVLVSVAMGVGVGLTITAFLGRLRHGSENLGRIEPRVGSPAVIDVLFIGNSLTAAYYDIPRNLMRISNLADSPKRLEAHICVLPAAGLTEHWEHGVALNRIQQGGWDFVVLQENSFEAVLQTDSMHRVVREFDREIKKVGARTVLYMTWNPQACLRFPPPGNPTVARIGRFFGFRSCWLGRDPVYHLLTGACRKGEPLLPLDAWLEAHVSIAGEIDALVAPVGLAWDLVLKEDPSRPLYRRGGNHPTQLGAYLAVCVLYATICDTSPVGLPNQLFLFERDGTERKTIHIDESDARLVQRTSWQAIQEQGRLASQRPSPETTEGWFALAMVYETEGKAPEALDAWEAYLDHQGTKTAIARRHMAQCRARLAAKEEG